MSRATIGPNAAIPLRYVNRHALITGPTGTGKTVSVLRYAESLAQAGVSVFLADVKGDMSPLSRTCNASRVDLLSGSTQVPVWAMGADLLARAMELSDTQAATLEIAFTHATRQGLPLDTLQHLRDVLAAMLDDRGAISATLGQLSPASVGVIQRGILRLENAGAIPFFGPARFDVATLLEPGKVTILDATRLFNSPRLYGAFLLWLMRELWQRLPERGDAPLPILALVFDECHTVFHEASPALLRQTEATARLIRSKGVGLVWASQSPSDLPAIIAEQCATRLQHDRALGVGKARFVTLDDTGKPTPPRIISPDLPACGLQLASVPDAAPLPVSAPQPVDVPDMTGHVRIGFALLVALAGAAAWAALSLGPVPLAAVALGSYLGIRSRL